MRHAHLNNMASYSASIADQCITLDIFLNLQLLFKGSVFMYSQNEASKWEARPLLLIVRKQQEFVDNQEFLTFLSNAFQN